MSPYIIYSLLKLIINFCKSIIIIFKAIRKHLVNLYKIQIIYVKFNRSGTEEEYGEKCQLLQEICDMSNEFHKKPFKPSKNQISNKKLDQNEGYKARINATQGR